MRENGSNALASSIVLVCRLRSADAPKTTRRDFLNALRRELPGALKTLQQGNIAPVDLAQATIGPGMAVFSRYSAVLESDGSPMRVRTALQLINAALDEVLSEQEGDFDPATRWAVSWFEQFGMNEGQYGTAETLSKAKNTSVAGMKEAGLVASGGGKVRLLRRDELPDESRLEAGAPSGTEPRMDRHSGTGSGRDARGPRGMRENGAGYGAGGTSSVWTTMQRLIRALDQGGEGAAAALLRQVGDDGEAARELAYRLYLVAERKGWAQEALAYNGLVIAWPTLLQRASELHGEPEQLSLV